MPRIPSFGESELDYIRGALSERFKVAVEIHLADAELRLHADRDTLTECPAAFWQARGCSFVLFKTGDGKYRCQFFYQPTEQSGTGHAAYDDLPRAVMALLQVQADHERELEGVSSGSTGANLK